MGEGASVIDGGSEGVAGGSPWHGPRLATGRFRFDGLTYALNANASVNCKDRKRRPRLGYNGHGRSRTDTVSGFLHI